MNENIDNLRKPRSFEYGNTYIYQTIVITCILEDFIDKYANER